MARRKKELARAARCIIMSENKRLVKLLRSPSFSLALDRLLLDAIKCLTSQVEGGGGEGEAKRKGDVGKSRFNPRSGVRRAFIDLGVSARCAAQVLPTREERSSMEGWVCNLGFDVIKMKYGLKNQPCLQ